MAAVNKGERKGRDNFSQAMLKILYKRAGGKCCKCGASTFGPVSNNPYQTVNIGKGAHIAAAAPGGPRYDKAMSPEERSSATNGMWLCSNCHDLIDRDPEAYPTKNLKEMKKNAEDRVRKELGVPTFQENKVSSIGTDLITGVSAAAIIEVRQLKAKLMETSTREEIGEILRELNFLDVEEDDYKVEVGREMMLLLRQIVIYCKDSSILLEVIRRFQSIANCFNSKWKKDEVELLCDAVIMAIKSFHSKRSKVYQSGVALLKDVSSYTAIKEHRLLHTVPLNAIKTLRVGRDEVDAGNPPPSKRSHQMDDEDSYLNLIEELAHTTDTDTALQIEHQLQEMGYEPHIQ